MKLEEVEVDHILTELDQTKFNWAVTKMKSNLVEFVISSLYFA